MNYFDFALIIKEKRIKKGLTQTDVSKLIPVARSRYNYIENGKKEPTFYELVSICEILDIDFTKETRKKEVNFRPHYD